MFGDLHVRVSELAGAGTCVSMTPYFTSSPAGSCICNACKCFDSGNIQVQIVTRWLVGGLAQLVILTLLSIMFRFNISYIVIILFFFIYV